MQAAGRCFVKLLLLAGTALSSLGVAAQGLPASIPADKVGIYVLSMDAATTASPIAAGAQVTVVVGADGMLCVDELVLRDPVLTSGSAARALWGSTPALLRFELALTTPGLALQVKSSSGALHGTLLETTLNPDVDDRARLSPLCSVPPTTDPNIYDAFFNAVEDEFRNVFPGGDFTLTQVGGGYSYRYYPATGIYLLARNGVASVRGGAYGEDPVELGVIETINVSNIPIPGPVPAGNFGTYVLTLTTAAPFSPVPEGTTITFVITPDQSLCVGEMVLTHPLHRNGDTDLSIWENQGTNARYSLSHSFRDTEENRGQGEIGFTTIAGDIYGLFAGDKTSLHTVCADSKGPDPDLADINYLFDLAENRLPQLFPAGPLTYNQRNDGFTYRYYTESGIYAAVRDREVYLQGGRFGSEVRRFGTLDETIALLDIITLPATLPSILVGTYLLDFQSAGQHSPIADGTLFKVALTADGNMCLEDVVLNAPVTLRGAPDTVLWENASADIRIGMVLSDSDGIDLELAVNTLTGLPLGILSGTRSSLAADCSRSNGSGPDMATINQLFALAEQYYPESFPGGLLSGTQANEHSVFRYYPSTGVTLAVTDGSVTMQGGAYGPTPVDIGTLDNVIQQMKTDNLPVYRLQIEGQEVVSILSLASVFRPISMQVDEATRPASTDEASLRAVIQSSMAERVKNLGAATISVVTDTETTLIFDAVFTTTTVLAGSSTVRRYTLRFTYQQI